MPEHDGERSVVRWHREDLPQPDARRAEVGGPGGQVADQPVDRADLVQRQRRLGVGTGEVALRALGRLDVDEHAGRQDEGAHLVRAVGLRDVPDLPLGVHDGLSRREQRRTQLAQQRDQVGGNGRQLAGLRR